MTCEEMIDFIVSWREGKLPEEVKNTFEMHIDRCPCCHTFLNNYTTTAGMTTMLPECQEKAKQDCPEELINAILAARKADPRL